jgi:hypothetical protein
MMAKIPRTITEQGMNFQKMTSTYHRTRKQRGGAAPVETTGEVLPASMTGPMTTASSGILGGSATGRLDTMLSQTASLVKQVGGGSRKRQQKQKQQRKQQSRKQKQQKSRQLRRGKQQQSRKQQKQQKQRGGSHQPLGFGPAAPTSGDYTILSAQELKAAGLNPQWFDENQVNPAFGGAITVPGGKLN